MEHAILTQIGVLKSAAERLIAHLLAQDCVLCGAADSPAIVCDGCAADLPRLPDRLCPRCALPTPHGEVCGHCLASPPGFDATRAAWRYDFPLDKLIQAFKYGHRLALAPYFAQQLLPYAADLAALGAELIVPLPLHRERLRQRGFNQALELARPLARALHLPLAARACQRTRHTATQADLAWRERAGNVRRAFACTGDFTGRHVMVVDDVMTTGATLDEFARTLKAHGAARVSVLVLARALPKSA